MPPNAVGDEGAQELLPTGLGIMGCVGTRLVGKNGRHCFEPMPPNAVAYEGTQVLHGASNSCWLCEA